LGFDRRELAAIFVGGFAGAIARAELAQALPAAPGRWPWATFLVNIVGALLLGLVAGLALSHDTALLAGTAAVGSYTTFSTWMFETQRLGEDRQVPNLAANIVVSLVAGIAAAALGRLLGSHL